MKVTFITTGGTIDKVYFDAKGGFEIGESELPRMLEESQVTVAWEVLELMKKDSLDLTDDDRNLLLDTVQGLDTSRIVVTHGTDTMVQSALHLQSVHDKTIVFTGSLSPARFRASDAVFNVGAALTASQCMPPGVWICMNGEIFLAADVEKNVTKNRFERISEE
jgi:L-asparaginase